MSYPIPRAFARILALGACALGIAAVGASSAQAAVTSYDAKLACANAYQGYSGMTAGDSHGLWPNQTHLIIASRGGDWTLSSTYTSSNSPGGSTNLVPCTENTRFIDGFGGVEHIVISGWVVVGRLPNGSPYPTQYGTNARDCYGETYTVPHCTL